MLTESIFCIVIPMVITLNTGKYYRVEETYQCFSTQEHCISTLTRIKTPLKKFQTDLSKDIYCKGTQYKEIEQTQTEEKSWHIFW